MRVTQAVMVVVILQGDLTVTVFFLLLFVHAADFHPTLFISGLRRRISEQTDRRRRKRWQGHCECSGM